jgi:hypothetical protein
MFKILKVNVIPPSYVCIPFGIFAALKLNKHAERL